MWATPSLLSKGLNYTCLSATLANKSRCPKRPLTSDSCVNCVSGRI